MNNPLKYLAIAATTLALPVAAIADDIVGQIHIAAFGSTVDVDQVANTVTFVDVFAADDPANAQVAYADGDFAGLFGESATYFDFTYDPFAGPSTIWSVNADTYLVLDQISFIDETSGGIQLRGWGTAYLPGFEPTSAEWSFSADRTGEVFSFSSTTIAVPDAATTLLLLGSGLTILGLFGRFRNRKG